MKEAMRCHPGVSFPLERVVPDGGSTLCGVYLRAGTVVGINPAVIHHDKAIFGDDAADFRPERWMDSNSDRVKNMDRHLMTVWCPPLPLLLLFLRDVANDIADRHAFVVRIWRT